MITQKDIDGLVGISKPPVMFEQEEDILSTTGDDPTPKKKQSLQTNSSAKLGVGAGMMPSTNGKKNGNKNDKKGSGGGGDIIAEEMKVLYKRPLPVDNKPAYMVAKDAAKKVGISPELLFSSSFQEGMNKAIAKPDEISEAYDYAMRGKFIDKNGRPTTQEKLDSKQYPVDGFYNYGLDRFGERYKELIQKGYLPENFDFKPFKAYNEKGELVITAAFRNNESALMAKAAMMKDAQDKITKWAAEKGVELDDAAMNYFILATYNTGEGNAKKMFEKYLKAPNKKSWLEKGDPNWQKVHKNLKPRMKRLELARQLMSENEEVRPNKIVNEPVAPPPPATLPPKST